MDDTTQNKKSQTEKRLKTLEQKAEEKKKAIVSELRKNPISTSACAKVGVGRSTYYEWRHNDDIFARAADHAMKSGRFLVNDMCESQLIKQAQAGNPTAIIFWLKNNHPRYCPRVIHEYQFHTDEKSAEKDYASTREFAKQLAWEIGPNSSSENIKRYHEARELEYEREEKDQELLDKYKDDEQLE